MYTQFHSPYQPDTGLQPSLFMTRSQFDGIVAFAMAAAPQEICGVGFVKLIDNWSLQVIPDSLFIPEQGVNPGFSRPTVAGAVQMMDREKEFHGEGVFRLLWHSHVAGQASFSPIDTATHDKTGRTTAYPASAFMVVNCFGNATAYLELYRPLRLTVPLRVIVEQNVESDELEPYEAIVARKCTYLPQTVRKNRPVRVYGSSREPLYGNYDLSGIVPTNSPDDQLEKELHQ